MKKITPHFLCLLGVILLTACTPAQKHKKPTPWAHIELGAGNYGEDGHTKTSQAKTVLREFTYVSKAPNYIDDLPVRDEAPYNTQEQYAVLFQTLDQLVQKKGDNGVFHVNDLYREYAEVAEKHLRDYAKEKGYTRIKIEVVAGDYMLINPEVTLRKYNKSLYDSAHLKNIELSFFYYGMDGYKFLANKESRAKARKKLQHLANLSKDGLVFFVIDVDGLDFIPAEEKQEFIAKNEFYSTTSEWQPVSYYLPEEKGRIIAESHGNVYLIKNNSL